ncbi:hypothetical protein C8R43DRAFT_1229785 [Mycena crocata]|nr:hypothetical protein C8R43DRAFT_1229785 [Mycena crocata]
MYKYLSMMHRSESLALSPSTTISFTLPEPRIIIHELYLSPPDPSSRLSLVDRFKSNSASSYRVKVGRVRRWRWTGMGKRVTEVGATSTSSTDCGRGTHAQTSILYFKLYCSGRVLSYAPPIPHAVSSTYHIMTISTMTISTSRPSNVNFTSPISNSSHQAVQRPGAIAGTCSSALLHSSHFLFQVEIKTGAFLVRFLLSCTREFQLKLQRRRARPL